MRIAFRRKIAAQVAIFDDESTRELMLCGGFGAGKTAILVYKGIKLSYQNRGFAGGLLVPSIPEFKRDFLPMMLDVFQREIPGATYHQSGKFGMHFMFPWSKEPLYVFSAERQVKGPNLGWLLVNEMSLIKWERIKEFLARRRLPHVPCPQVIFAGTPEDEYDWLDAFITKRTASGRLKVHYATSFDNPFNDESYGADLLENFDEDEAQVYVYGRPGRIGNNYFFRKYSPANNDFEIEYDPELLVHASLDFNVGRMCCGFAHIFGNGSAKQVGYFDQLKIKGTDADTEGMAKAIKARYGTQNVLITCDASGKNRKTTGRSDVQVLESHGFKVRYTASNPPIRRSQIVTNSLFAKRQILVHPTNCPDIKKDFLKVKQKADYDIDKSNIELTHFGDGVRYLVHHEFPNFLDRGKNRAEILPLGV